MEINEQADRVARTLRGLALQVGGVPSWEVADYLKWLAAQALEKPKDEEVFRNVWVVCSQGGSTWFGEDV